MDAVLWKAVCGRNANGSVGLHKQTHKLKQQFFSGPETSENSVTIYLSNFPPTFLVEQMLLLSFSLCKVALSNKLLTTTHDSHTVFVSCATFTCTFFITFKILIQY